jgi:hypothetical protein
MYGLNFPDRLRKITLSSNRGLQHFRDVVNHKTDMFSVLSCSDFKSRSNSNQPYKSMVQGLLKEYRMYQNSEPTARIGPSYAVQACATT